MWRRWLALGALFGVAFALRCLLYPSIFTSQGVHLYGNDAYYHLRRILWSVHNYPAFLDIDPYLAFPEAGSSIWSPTIDWLLAGAFRIYPGAEAAHAIPGLVVWLPPLLGGAAVVALYLLAERFFPQRVAWLAASILSLLPGAWLFGLLGYVDHHIWIQLAAIGILAACMEFVRPLPTPREHASRAVLLGTSWAVAVAIWPGAMLHVVISQIGLVARCVTIEQSSEERQWTFNAALAHGVACLLILPLCLREGWWPISSLVLSGFQVLWFAIAAAGFGLATLGRTLVGHAAMRLSDRMLIGLGILGIIIGVSLSLLPGLSQEAADALDWLTRRERFQALVDESLPLFVDGTGRISLAFARSYYSYLILIFPFALAAEFWAQVRGRSSAPRAMLLFWATALFLAALTQRRFGNSFSIVFALQGASSFWRLFDWIRLRVPDPRPQAMSLVTVGLVLLAMSTPVWAQYRFFLWDSLSAVEGGATMPPMALARHLNLNDLGRWIAANTPPTAGYWERDANPEYAVLAPWEDGHILRHYAQRPVTQDNFGDDVSPANFREADAYFLAPTESDALRIAARLGVRYVAAKKTGAGQSSVYPAQSQLVRLFHLRGSRQTLRPEGDSGPIMSPALSRHRLVYQSPPTPWTRGRPGKHPPEYQLFEIVPGALIRGETLPGAPVELRLDITPPFSDAFVYSARVRADKEGRYAFRVPYATSSPGEMDSGSNGRETSPEVRTGESYRIRSGDREERIAVSEEAVLGGEEVGAPPLVALRIRPEQRGHAHSP